MSSSTVVVLGGTGMIARCLVRRLHTLGVPVIAAVRDMAKAQAQLPSGVRLARVDLKDPVSLQHALHGSGATRAYGLLDVVGKEQLEALKAAGISHFVYVSTSFLGLPTEQTMLQQMHSGFESVIRASGLTYTFLRCEAFMSNSPNRSHTHAQPARTAHSHSLHCSDWYTAAVSFAVSQRFDGSNRFT